MADRDLQRGRRDEDFAEQIARKASRKEKTGRRPAPPLWTSFSLFGVVGWSVAMPTVVAIAVGVWLDNRIADRHSWTLVMIPVGLAIGCALAWRWISHERHQIEENEQEEKK